jgi:hypothetical protein
MKSPERRVRKWLRVYPRAYRERRGEELVATLLDKARDDPRLPAREIASVLAHGGWMRARRLRVLAVAVVVAVAGAGFGAVIGFWGEPTGYTTTVTPRSMELPHTLLSHSQVAVLRSLTVHFDAFQLSPTGIMMMNRGIDDRNGPLHMVCSDGVVNSPGNRGIEMQCASSNANAARTVTSNLALAFRVMYERLEANGSPSPGAAPSTVTGPLVATHGITAFPVALGAMAGLLLGIGIGRTKKKRQLVRQVVAG